VLLTLLLAIATSAAPPQDAAAVRRQVLDTYNFRPANLNAQQQTEKSKALDEFWDRAKARPDAYLPVVRTMLQEPSSPSFFFYDGSMLLLELSSTAEDRAMAAAAIAKCDLRDVDPTQYFRAVHRLAALGTDVTPAALHLLDDANFKVFVPQHALTLSQDYAFAYLVLPLDESRWVPTLAKRLGTEADPTAQKTLLMTLWYAQTKDADDALSAFEQAKDKPVASQAYARELLLRNAAVQPGASEFANLPSEADLRASRRTRMKSVSDEALFDLDDLTKQIIARRKRGG